MIMSSDNLIKKRFVGNVLKEQSEKFLKFQESGMRKRLKFHTYNILNCRKLSITEGGNYMDGQLDFENVFYERMLDMRRTVRNKKQGGYTTKRFSIHNRFVMGAYYSIAYKLMYGLTEEVKNGIKEELLKDI